MWTVSCHARESGHPVITALGKDLGHGCADNDNTFTAGYGQ